MVDVGGDDGTSGCYFWRHEFRSDVALDAEGFGIVQFSRMATYSISGVMTPWRASAIWVISTTFGRAAGCVAVAEAD